MNEYIILLFFHNGNQKRHMDVELSFARLRTPCRRAARMHINLLFAYLRLVVAQA